MKTVGYAPTEHDEQTHQERERLVTRELTDEEAYLSPWGDFLLLAVATLAFAAVSLSVLRPL